MAGGGYIHSSTDGANWQQRESPTFQKLWDVAYGSDTFILVGFNGTILQSGFLSESPASIDWISPAFALGGGGDYVVTATVRGRAPFAYQWFRDDVAIPGANDYYLQLPINGEHEGNYHLVVTNEFGQATSDPITFITIEPEFGMTISYENDIDFGSYAELRIDATPGQFYNLFVIDIPGPVEWQYLDSIFVEQPNQIYQDYTNGFPPGRLYQLRDMFE